MNVDKRGMIIASTVTTLMLVVAWFAVSGSGAASNFLYVTAALFGATAGPAMVFFGHKKSASATASRREVISLYVMGFLAIAGALAAAALLLDMV